MITHSSKEIIGNKRAVGLEVVCVGVCGGQGRGLGNLKKRKQTI